MATLLQIHSAYIKAQFENPPRLLPNDRENLFELPAWAESVMIHLHSDVSRLGFILQVGYFRATHRFFPLSRFQQGDAQYVITRFRLALEAEEIGAYPSSTHWDHQAIICSQSGFSRFTKTHREQLLHEAKRLSSAHMRPDELFDYLICYLEERRVEIPSYRTFAELITNALLMVEKQLLAQLEQVITPADEAWLDQLLQPHSDYGPTDDRLVKRYTLTYLKQISQSLRAGSIRERVENYRYLQSVFIATQPLMTKLNLPDQSIRYYAQYVLRSQPAQLYRRDKQRYLFLIGFITHQYYEWTDALVDTLLQAVSHFFSQCEARLKEQYYEERQEASQLTQQVTDRSREQLTALAAIRQVVKQNEIDQAQKLNHIEQLIDRYFPNEQAWQVGVTTLDQLEQINDRYHHQHAYYEWLRKHSIKLQRKVSSLLRLLVIDETTSKKDLVLALRHFARNKELGDSPPINFLPPAQQGKILVVLGRVRTSLYKVLLFQQAALAIKSGQLNFLHSYRYRAFESYLIPLGQWHRERAELLSRANLDEFMDSTTVLDVLTSQLQKQLVQTNEHILLGQNAHVTRKKDKLVIQTPKTALDSLIQPNELFPTNKVVSLQEVLATVNRLTRFTETLTHWQPKYIPKRPPTNLFLAAIMALGCNVGVRRMAQITRSVSENSLDEIVKWYCTLDNLQQANESVLRFTRELKLRIHLKDHPDITYTSSDGQKMEVAQDSLLARPSFKYFGNRRGIAAYSYTDDTMLLFDSLVFSAGDREATYLLNGLVNTHIVDSDVHSSDSHGATEPVFASTYLMGIHYEPRIKRLLYQQFYSIDSLSLYKDLKYPITPRGRINTERIKVVWDTMLRLMVTIKLHYSLPSELFNRLNSYAHLHPVYQGLREFGRIIKTIFLLRYIDQVTIRQRIQRQLNRSESVHQLARSVWFGRHGQMGWVNPGEQQVAETAKRLIMNCIICHNYLHLSEKLSKMTNREERRQFVQRLSKLTVLTHHHINFNGVYDFPDEVADWDLPFDLSNISDLDL